MAGLLGDVLPFVYSRADALKRRVGGLLSDPVGTLTQAVNDANDRAGGLLSQTRAAAGEGLNYGPATQSLAQSIAAAYNPMGITVYHGSPHKFAKFDSSKIGTGEGAQAYGHGLYLAESPEVAKSYQKALSGWAQPKGWAAKYPQSARAYIQEMAHEVATGKETPERAARMVGYANANMREYDRALLAREILEAAENSKGALYKVDLPDSAVARMLDWDKPLSQQAPEVRQALAKFPAQMKGQDAYSAMSYGVEPAGFDDAGRALFDGMAALRGRNPANAVQALRQQGIPGIRYLDGGSRGLGSGTSNFVIFPGEESLLTILERNGAPVR